MTQNTSNNQPFQAVKISEHVYWVGAIDWGLRDFHGYATERGTTYNAYLILADKVTLIDTVKAPFMAEMMARIASVIDPKRIDFIISNHAEMDHSGALPAVIQAVEPAAVFASTMGVKALTDHHLAERVTAVKDGETLSLGNFNLTFYETRMLHWPDSMFTYLQEEALLFSNDAFGMHLASAERFDDELDPAVLHHETEKYYANILTPYSHLILRLLEKLQGLSLDIKMIAPDHGPVWRSGISTVVEDYARWARLEPTNKVVIVYDTMWESTARMARAIAEGVTAAGAKVALMPLNANHRSEIATELLEAGALLVGSPTLNNNLFPTVADVLTYLRGLKRHNLVGAAFGSYGWSGEAVSHITEVLTAMKVELISDGVKVKYVPDADVLAQCVALGRQAAETVTEKIRSAS
ncbi:MAG: FprA family A-type flavoprotein [Armatimonadota bacterium]